ncbi:hypothetical protein M3E18_03515 [Kocuria sp. p3-SID1433]|uniref:hypothetical protein n=1 Tax=unclassified Kocuria TaxID=2649579 RepID=UPI0021A3594A|nr:MULTISPECIES: hypothetical protein [unclassified Kocuria]MCT1602130.1 hypothetical protein [Kocuria sp. p3-SID1428]MCT2179615.1 hypothetical protein [Kocuria sp. p3-SID1433]
MIEGQPTWAGTGREAVLTWIHTPEDGTSRGIVVLAAPAGREQALSMLAVRRLAILLARHGYTAVRFFWRGTSDSQPLWGDPDLVGRWQDDVRTVVEHVRQLCALPEAPLHGIGYRVGAAVLAAMREEFETLVAWEPVSGGAMVRQWARLRTAIAAATPQRDGEVDLMGLVLTSAQADSLAALPAPSGPSVVEIKEKDRRRAKAMYGVEPFDTRLHDDVFARIMDALPDSAAQQGAFPHAAALQNEWMDGGGVRLHERIVHVGPEPRTGIVTWAEGSLSSHPSDAARGRRSPAVPSQVQDDMRAEDLRWSAPGLIVSGGGPDGRAGGGEWPQTARELAADGLVVLRCDRPLVADSTPVDDVRASNPYTLRSAIGMQDMIDWLRGHGCPQVHAGLHCASAWAACLGELHGHPVSAESMVLIGHAEWKMDPEWWAGFREVYDADAPPAERAQARSAYLGLNEDEPSSPSAEPEAQTPCPLRALVGIAARRLRDRDLRGLRAEVRPEIVRWMRFEMPYPLWLRLNRSGRISGPESVLEPMSARQPVVVVNGPEDLERWEQTRADRAVAQLARRGRAIREVRLPHMDHSLLTSCARRQLTEVLRESLPIAEAAVSGGAVRAS